MKTRKFSHEQLAAHERQQARLAERDAYAGHFTVNEAAKLVSLTPNAVEQAIHSGRLPATKIAYPPPWGSWRISLDALRSCWPDLARLKPGRPSSQRSQPEGITQDEAPELFDLDHINPRLHPEERDASVARQAADAR